MACPGALQAHTGLAGEQAASDCSEPGLRLSVPLPLPQATGASWVLSGVMEVPYVFDPTINLLALLFSAVIGVLFGYVPARRAARMDPIEALRHE